MRSNCIYVCIFVYKGEQGSDGEVGLTGKTGSQGETGQPGLQGSQGSFGPKVVKLKITCTESMKTVIYTGDAYMLQKNISSVIWLFLCS